MDLQRGVDQWNYAEDGKGDCEDYALRKQLMLRDYGILSLMTIIKDKEDKWHSVLTVPTDQGDLVLDIPDFASEVQFWTEPKHFFRKRQSPSNPNVWLAIERPSQTSRFR